MSDISKTELNMEEGQPATHQSQDPPPPYTSTESTASGALYAGNEGVSFPHSCHWHPTQPPCTGVISQLPVQNQVQTVYIQTLPAVSRDYSSYNGKYSTIFGITNILLTTICIVLNGVAFPAQSDRSYDWTGNIWFLICPAAFCGFFIYLASAFSIASGRHKIACLIIAHLVLAIIASVFAFAFVAFSIAALAYEAVAWTFNETISLGISIVWLLMSVTMFILTTWCCVLCCKVLCCGRSRTTIPVTGNVVMMADGNRATAGGVVLYINANH